MKKAAILLVIAVAMVAGCLTGCATITKDVSNAITDLETDAKTLSGAVTSQKECLEGRYAAYYFFLNLSPQTRADMYGIFAESDNMSVTATTSGNTVMSLKDKAQRSADFNTCYRAALYVITMNDMSHDAVSKNGALIDEAIAAAAKLGVKAVAAKPPAPAK